MKQYFWVRVVAGLCVLFFFTGVFSGGMAIFWGELRQAAISHIEKSNSHLEALRKSTTQGVGNSSNELNKALEQLKSLDSYASSPVVKVFNISTGIFRIAISIAFLIGALQVFKWRYKGIILLKSAISFDVALTILNWIVWFLLIRSSLADSAVSQSISTISYSSIGICIDIIMFFVLYYADREAFD